MKYAEVIDNIVKNIVIFDRVPEDWPSQLVLIPEDAQIAIGWLYNGDGSFSEPVSTETSSQETQATKKLRGIEFETVMCSATSEDMFGLAAVRPWIDAGQTINFEFRNGQVLALHSGNIAAFEAVWVPFRTSFF